MEDESKLLDRTDANFNTLDNSMTHIKANSDSPRAKNESEFDSTMTRAKRTKSP